MPFDLSKDPGIQKKVGGHGGLEGSGTQFPSSGVNYLVCTGVDIVPYTMSSPYVTEL